MYRHLRTFESFKEVGPLFEVGDRASMVDWSLIHSSDRLAVYGFDLGPVEYRVHILRVGPTEISVEFYADGDRDSVTNDGYPLTVLSTVTSIIDDYLLNNSEVKTVSFVPTVNYPGDRRRLNVYLYYLKRVWKDRIKAVRIQEIGEDHISVEIDFLD